ncbi:MAG: NADH-quinone oxidoreductase subunit C [Spirochaetes bacterium]|nr:NADH-quinone oxidoreductase subunit C [Spirochaetota bacterium]
MKDIVGHLKKEFKSQIIEVYTHNAKRIYVKIPREALVKVAEFLYKKARCRFAIASGMDTRDGLEIIYHFSDDAGSGVMINLKISVPHKDPQVESLTCLFKGAEWIEREMHELLGIKFKNHPNLVTLLLPEDWPKGVYPLRRNYKNE